MAGNPDPADYGWWLMECTDYKAVYYRWRGETRVELVLSYDRRGNLHGWSVWENVRTSLDMEPNKRHRLNKFLAESIEAV